MVWEGVRGRMNIHYTHSLRVFVATITPRNCERPTRFSWGVAKVG